MNKILFTIILVCFSALLFLNTKQNFTNKKPNPCTDFLSDTEFLEHMIPHHQVAVDMSKRLLLHTNNSYLIDFCRKLIIDQQGEIFLMNDLLNNSYIHKSPLLDNNY